MALADFEAVMKAAGEPVRARILKLLEGRELCVCEIIAVLRLGQSTVSGHLSILKNAGLVKDRKDGRWMHYSLASQMPNNYGPPMLALMLSWLDDDNQVRADKRRLASLKGGAGIGPDGKAGCC
jgi:arsenate reductase/ArsR family transcriptional regulator